MHIGILGTGFGKYHGELYKKIDPTINLTFWGRNEEKLKDIQSQLNCDYTTDLDAFLDKKTFDFIDICLPSELHSTFALKALDKNHSIFLETPAVISREEGLKIIEAAKKRGKKVLVNRFLLSDPYYSMIHELSKSNNYGELKHISIFRRTPPLWGPLGTDKIALSLMIHDLDFATWLGNNLKLDTLTTVSNSDNSGAVIDCILTNTYLHIHLQGNSMLSYGSPFTVGYEATFENTSISYYEHSFEDAVESQCYLYTEGRKEKITFELEDHCKDLLRKVIQDFGNHKDSDLSLENAMPALSLAFDMTSHSNER